jgi:hypothetical protein
MLHFFIGDFKYKKEDIATFVKSTSKSISLVIAESNYGVSKGDNISSEFDLPEDKWGGEEFEQAIEVVRDAIGKLENTRWVFFVSSKQLGDVLTALAANNMCFKLLVWTEQTNKPALGRSWRHNCEYIVFCLARLGEGDAERLCHVPLIPSATSHVLNPHRWRSPSCSRVTY